METSINGIMSPTIGGEASKDTVADLILAVRTNAAIMEKMFTVTGSLPTSQTDFASAWYKDINGIIHQYGHPTPVRMVKSGTPVIGKIVFPTAFPTLCISVHGSDVGGAAMSYGFYNYTKTGCTWCTLKGSGEAGGTYAPKYEAIGK